MARASKLLDAKELQRKQRRHRLLYPPVILMKCAGNRERSRLDRSSSNSVLPTRAVRVAQDDVKIYAARQKARVPTLASGTSVPALTCGGRGVSSRTRVLHAGGQWGSLTCLEYSRDSLTAECSFITLLRMADRAAVGLREITQRMVDSR